MSDGESSNGRTPAFEAEDRGSNPCPPAKRNYHAEWYERNKVERRKQIHARRAVQTKMGRAHVRAYLELHACVDCPESDSVVLDFDHVRGEKKKSVSDLVATGYSLTAIDDEIAKCEVRCANCHRRRHARMREF